MGKKVRIRPPRFRISVARKDVEANIDTLIMSNGAAYSMLMRSLEMLSERLSHNQLAPLPKDLQGSLYDPKMLQMRSDEEFKEIYTNDLKGTAEECMAIMMVNLIAYDVANGTKRCIQKPSDDALIYPRETTKDGIIRCAKELRQIFNSYSYSLYEYNVVGELYLYVIRFAEALYLDLNAFIKWFIRYRNLC